MKNSLLLLFILFSVSILADNLPSNDLQISNLTPKIMEKIGTFDNSYHSRYVPQVGFSIHPIQITPSYWNYMIGGFYSPPIVRQPEVAGPYDFLADGIYTAFMYQENPSTKRRIYYSYIDNEVSSSAAPIGSQNIWEGYMSMAIDPETANPLIVKHGDYNDDDLEEVVFSYDKYNIVGAPGLWEESVILNSTTEGMEGYDKFIWPVIKIGASPLAEHRRVHIFTQARVTDSSGVYNTVYGYADFIWSSVEFNFEFSDWSFQTIPLLDTWQVEEGKWVNKNLVVSESDGKAIFVGFNEDKLFTLVSDNYGLTFEPHIFEGKFPVFNPQNQDGTYLFTNEDETPGEVFIAPSHAGGHFNAQLTPFEDAIIFPTAMGVTTTEALENGNFLVEFFYPKIIRYNLSQNEFQIIDIQTTGLNPNDNIPVTPWDLDDDGEVDSFDEAGNVQIADSWPSYYFGGDYVDGAFYESTFYLSSDSNGSGQVVVFQDSRNHRKAYFNTPGYEEWYEKAEIAVCYSNDYGQTWSEVGYLNANPNDENYNPQLYGMKPCYIYPVEEIEMVADHTPNSVEINLPILFYDATSYGGFYPPPPYLNPGTIMYAQLSVVTDFNSSPEDVLLPSEVSLSNYPNPFNPSTEIRFTAKDAEDAKIEIYNIKGQKVKSYLITSSTDSPITSVTWNGTDNHNNPVSSGIYFATLKSKDRVLASRKMLLLK